MTMIAADGALFEPITVDCFVSTPGERYDFILDTLTDRRISECRLVEHLRYEEKIIEFIFCRGGFHANTSIRLLRSWWNTGSGANYAGGEYEQSDCVTE